MREPMESEHRQGMIRLEIGAASPPEVGTALREFAGAH